MLRWLRMMRSRLAPGPQAGSRSAGHWLGWAGAWVGAGLSLFWSGCATSNAGSGTAANAAPGSTFSVTLEDRVENSLFQMLKLRIRAPAAEMMRLQDGDDPTRNTVPLSRGEAGSFREGHVIVAATMVHNRPLEPGARYQVFEGVESRGARSQWQGSYDLISASRLEEVFAVTITNGTYPTDRALVVGTRGGEPIRLFVGRWD
jgi:hypothetical protein